MSTLPTPYLIILKLYYDAICFPQFHPKVFESPELVSAWLFIFYDSFRIRSFHRSSAGVAATCRTIEHLKIIVFVPTLMALEQTTYIWIRAQWIGVVGSLGTRRLCSAVNRCCFGNNPEPHSKISLLRKWPFHTPVVRQYKPGFSGVWYSLPIL
jgi:hypothetical protein